MGTKVNNEEMLCNIVEALPALREFHHRDGKPYQVLHEIAAVAVQAIFGETGPQRARLGPIGEIALPFVSMGAINSTHLFGLDEIIIFAFYLRNTRNYRRVADIGANIGLHSIVLARLGYEVECFEPDPRHLELLEANLRINGVTGRVQVQKKAVSTEVGSVEFIRVHGNTTGSHLAGAKKDPYGELERLTVPTAAFLDIVRNVDLVKLDVEGHELAILTKTKAADWARTDAMIEVGTPENAAGIFSHMNSIGVNMFSQKNSWRRVTSLEDVPTSHREGSLFLTTRTEMNWS